MDVITLAKQSLKQHEGFRRFAYQCPADKTTVGYGRNLDDKGISEREAEFLLDNDIVECLQDLRTFPYWHRLNDSQQAALLDLRFCLGPNRFRSFRKMGAALEAGNYQEAANQILDSEFARQTGNRANDLAEMMTA